MNRTVALPLMLLGSMISAQAGDVAIRVVPDKILYVYGEPAQASVSITNRSDQPRQGELRLEEEWEIEASRVLETRSLALKPGESQSVLFTWKTGDQMGGRAVRARWVESGKELAQKAEFYQVADPTDWFRCVLISWAELKPEQWVTQGTGYSKSLDRRSPFETYGNYRNWFAYAACDFGGMAPASNLWLSGQGSNYQMDKSRMLEQIRIDRERGIRNGAYTQIPTGPLAWDMAREHPEWFLRNDRGSLLTDQWWPLDPLKIAARKPQTGPIIPDFGSPDVMRMLTNDLASALRMFEWDGLYIDGMYQCPYGSGYLWDGTPAHRQQDTLAQSVRVFEAIREATRHERPSLAIWCNGVMPLPPGAELKRAYANGPNQGALKEISWANLSDPRRTDHIWRNFYETLLINRNAAVREHMEDAICLVGYLIVLPPPAEGETNVVRHSWVNANHVGAILASMRFHPAALGSWGFRPPFQMITRYSDLIWGRGIRYLDQPERRGIRVENNRRDLDPETGNLGRMNTWLFEQLAKGDARGDAELVGAWLEREFGAPQPGAVVDALLDADRLASEGIQWGRGIHNRQPFASLHTTKLYWMFDGFIQPDFPYVMANPTRELLEGLIRMKHEAYDSACMHVARLEAARAAMHPGLFGEIHAGYSDFAAFILLVRDWSSYLLMQYGIERGVFPADRPTLGRMSRYAETFIRNLVRLHDTPAGKRAREQLTFPDAFPLT
jgi:hypothetical protein